MPADDPGPGKQIFFGTFYPVNLTKLGQGMADKMTNGAVQEAKGMVHLSHCVEVYGQIVLHFAYPSLIPKLQLALAKYQIRLADLSVTYKFESVRDHNATFMRQRILLGEDDPAAWSVIDSQFNDDRPSEGPKYASNISLRICLV